MPRIDRARKRFRRRGIRFALLYSAVIAAYVLLILNVLQVSAFDLGYFRFAAPLANVFAVLVACALPFLGIVVALYAPWDGLKVGGSICLIPFALASLPLAVFGAWVSGLTWDPTSHSAFQLTSEAPAPSGWIRVYLTDLGAIGDVGVVVRQEHSVAFGLRRVKTIYGRHPALPPSIVEIGDSYMELEFPPYDTDQRNRRVRVRLE